MVISDHEKKREMSQEPINIGPSYCHIKKPHSTYDIIPRHDLPRIYAVVKGDFSRRVPCFHGVASAGGKVDAGEGGV